MPAIPTEPSMALSHRGAAATLLLRLHGSPFQLCMSKRLTESKTHLLPSAAGSDVKHSSFRVTVGVPMITSMMTSSTSTRGSVGECGCSTAAE